MASGTDPLFDVKNSYYLGEFQKCISHAQKIKTSANNLERDAFMYRAYLGLDKYQVVLDELKATQSLELKSIALVAEYLQIRQVSAGDESKKATVLKKLDDIQEKLTSVGGSTTKHIFFIAAATIYCYEENYEAALRVLHNSDHLECLAYSVYTYCKMERPDCAKEIIKRMQETEEDATLTQLSEAMVNLQLNGEHVQEAYHIFHDLSEKYSASTAALNGMTTALICMGRWDEAEGYLEEALQKDPNNPSVLANLIVCSGHTMKSEAIIKRYISQLQDSHPNHPLTQLYLTKEAQFERVVRLYAPEVAS